MSYIELINNFWQRQQEENFTPVEGMLYFLLLDTCNGLNWKNPFRLGNDRAAAVLDISQKTLIAAREKLAAGGLIEYSPGNGRRILTAYLIKGCPKGCNISNLFEGKDPEKGPQKGARKGPEKVVKIPHYKRQDKTRQENEQASSSPDPSGVFNNSSFIDNCGSDKKGPNLSANGDGGTTPQPEPKSPGNAKIGKNNGSAAPDLQAVINYALQIGRSEAAARDFYAVSSGRNWKDGSGQPIRSWQALLSRWQEPTAPAGIEPTRTKADKPAPRPDCDFITL